MNSENASIEEETAVWIVPTGMKTKQTKRKLVLGKKDRCQKLVKFGNTIFNPFGKVFGKD